MGDAATGCATARRRRSTSTARPRCTTLVRGLVRERVVDGVHDCSDGGLAVALAEMAIAGGVRLRGSSLDRRSACLSLAWFSESASRVVLAVAPARVDEVLDAGRRRAAVPAADSASPAATACVVGATSTSRSPTPRDAWRDAIPRALGQASAMR